MLRIRYFREMFVLLLTVMGVSSLLMPMTSHAAPTSKEFGHASSTFVSPAFSISAGSQKSFVKGFPLLLRLTFRGPHLPSQRATVGFGYHARVPLISEFSPNANIKAILINQETQCRYEIASTRGQNIEMSGPDGGLSSDGTFLFYVSLGNDEERTMLLDLAALSSEWGGDPPLGQRPAGSYALWLENGSLKSDTVFIELREPSMAEREFVRQVVASSNHLPSGETRIWNDLLQVPFAPAPLFQTLTSLSEEACAQLTYHRFLLSLLTSKDFKGDRKKWEKDKVPTYLKPDKESLLYELDIALDRKEGKAESAKHQDKVAKFVAEYPGLSWRIEAARKGEAEFWYYTRARSEAQTRGHSAQASTEAKPIK